MGEECNLAARFLVQPQLAFINWYGQPEVGGRLAICPAPGQDDPYLIFFAGTVGHFPYGNEDFVEPDFPV